MHFRWSNQEKTSTEILLNAFLSRHAKEEQKEKVSRFKRSRKDALHRPAAHQNSSVLHWVAPAIVGNCMIRKLPSGEYRLYSRKKDPRTGKRKNLGTFKTRAAAEKHERDVQYFKRAH